MSDLLIRGVEMPKDRGMYIAIDIDGQTYAKPLGELKWKKLIQKAVPVPPHGRLSDADALYNVALKRSETMDGYYNCLDPVVSCYTIDHAPTIIPAEPCNNLSKPCKKEGE